MKLSLSVIVCTHNPRREYLDKVLIALKSQTLLLEKWELLLIDNASNQLLSSEIDLTWHPHAKHIREEQLGLTPARLRGIREAQTEILVFVDDDNVLDPDYLEVTLRIGQDYPFLGAWGGQVVGEFEVPPPAWAEPYLPFLAIREFNRDKWSNLLHQYETTPCGAGICVRKQVAEKYTELVNSSSARLKLGRTGKILTSGEDSDLAFTACDMGLGTGQFVALKLTHLIPANRLEESYFIKLMEGMSYSHRILDSFRGQMPEISKLSWRGKLLEQYRLLKMDSRVRRIVQATKRGEELALKTLSELHH
jgi:glycosyltransferase involved in cell wall biosynthesis